MLWMFQDPVHGVDVTVSRTRCGCYTVWMLQYPVHGADVTVSGTLCGCYSIRYTVWMLQYPVHGVGVPLSGRTSIRCRWSLSRIQCRCISIRCNLPIKTLFCGTEKYFFSNKNLECTYTRAILTLCQKGILFKFSRAAGTSFPAKYCGNLHLLLVTKMIKCAHCKNVHTHIWHVFETVLQKCTKSAAHCIYIHTHT